MSRKILSQYTYYFVFSCLGIVIGVVASNWSYFKMDSTIEVTDLITLFVTSLIGVYIGKSLQSQISSERSEKDFLISEIKELKTEFKKVKAGNNAGYFDFDEAKTMFKEINQNITHFENICSISTFCASIDHRTLRSEFTSLRNIVTGISPVNNRINIDFSTKALIEEKLNSLNSIFYTLIICINKI